VSRSVRFVGGLVTWSVVVIVVGPLVLAVRCTARVALVGMVGVLFAGAGVAVVSGVSPRLAAGGCLVVAGVVTAIWALGRWCRRWWVVRSATVAHRAAAALMPEVAAAVERERLAAVLHDVAAHRLTSIVVSAGAAARLSDPDLTAQAIRHAAVEGRRVVAELDRLAEADRSPLTLAEVDGIAAGFTGVDFRRTIDDAPSDVVVVVYRVVLEALTNAVRHASGAAVRVLVDGDVNEVTVTVADDGGSPAVVGVGSGSGLRGLRSAVTRCGGTFEAGPDGDGWVVRARLPIASPESRNRRPPLDWVSVLPAAATSIGFQLVSDERPDPLWSLLPSLALLVVLVAHTTSVGFRRRAPGWSLAVALGAFLVWLGFDLLDWVSAPVSDGFLVLCWVEFVLVHTVATVRPARSSWPAPAAVAVTGGVVLASGAGMTGSRPSAALVLAAVLAVPAFAVWAAGLGAAKVRGRRVEAVVRAHVALERSAQDAARTEHRRISAGVRQHARSHAEAVASAAEEDRLAVVLTRARAGLTALRRLLAVERSDVDGAPPTLAGIAVLAERRRAGYRRIGTARAVSPAVEVTAYRVAELLVTTGSVVTVSYLATGIDVVVSPARVDRRVRTTADAIGGRATADQDGTIRVWLPDPTRSP
jgi:signal transduction histidine kinase